MKALRSSALILAFCALVLHGCSSDSTEPPITHKYTMGMISGNGGWTDGFNLSCRLGLENAATTWDIGTDFPEWLGTPAYDSALMFFNTRTYDMIFLAAPLDMQKVKSYAEAHPSVRFVSIDGVDTAAINNVQHLVFNADEPAFALGYLAAAWAWEKDPKDPAVGVVRGMDIPPVRLISTGFGLGVNYYKATKKRTIRFEMSTAGTFNDTTLGGQLAQAQFAKGVDVIFPIAGYTGNGVLDAAVAAGKWAIGMDDDQYYSRPAARPILLSSCMKRLDLRVYSAVDDYINGRFIAGIVSRGTLANGGVALAPWHDFESQFSPALKAEIATVIAAINAGSVRTR